MRLLHTETRQLREFLDGNPPNEYFTLSHRWTGDEISYKEYCKGTKVDSPGYKKVEDCCKFLQAKHGSSWVWIDTICIDKRSSAELSEAINSMWEWYWGAKTCYAYLADVDISPGSEHENVCDESYMKELESQLRNSEWFCRGWTLQELLAPRRVQILNQNWQILGHKEAQDGLDFLRVGARGPNLNVVLSGITAIGEQYLEDRWTIQNRASIACRMSWASRRKTTKREDQAYCLLGIFNINMPLLYGEREGAFRRLQEELIRTSNDQSIFGWRLKGSLPRVGMLALGPSDFKHSGDISWYPAHASLCTMEITNRGVKVHGTVQKHALHLQTLIKRVSEDTDTRLRYKHILKHLGQYETNDRGNIELLGVPLNCRDYLSNAPSMIYLVRYEIENIRAWIRFSLDQYLATYSSNAREDVTPILEESVTTTVIAEAGHTLRLLEWRAHEQESKQHSMEHQGKRLLSVTRCV
ncbi:hypothetical protein CBER1_07233 [Cercospora berteroae]|uniref:Uncharacterized protein n=1 Tax=Cercospora berteroae TaxID=357750 RepID=A0A2S6CM90_9PEZI|nr:hypothetical protein CBER1_07233 [Cercospora berteroae]